MKKSKTLQHIAAVAVVLLTLCLVFMMPVGAEETELPPADAQGVITLTEDVVLSGQYHVPSDVMMIDGKGYTIYASDDWSSTSNEDKHLLKVTSQSNSPVTIKNVTFENKGKAYGLLFFDTGANTQHILEDVVINASVYTGLHLNGANVSVKNLQVSNSGYQSIDLSSGSGVDTASSLYLAGTIDLQDTFPIVVDPHHYESTTDTPSVSGAGFDKVFYVNYDYTYEGQDYVGWKLIWNTDYPTADDGFVAVISNFDIPDYYTSLTQLSSCFGDESVVTLLKDVTVDSTIEVEGKDVIINLNGYSITGTGFSGKTAAAGHLFDVKDNADLVIINSNAAKESKIISDGAGVYVETGGSFLAGDASSYSGDEVLPTSPGKITLDVAGVGVRAFGYDCTPNDGGNTDVYLCDNAVIETDVQGIVIYGYGYATNTNEAINCYNVSVFVNGEIKGTHPADGTYSGNAGIATNGNIQTGDCTIVLGPKAKITAVTGNTDNANNDDAPAIMSNGNAMWIIVGSTLEGDEAISMKSGTLVILDGTFKATGKYADPSKANDNGSEMTGATISVTNTYEEGSGSAGVSIVILGGTFESNNGHAIFAGQSDTHENTESVLMNLEIRTIDQLALSEEIMAQYEALFTELGADCEDIPLTFRSSEGKDAILLNALPEPIHSIGIAAGEYSTNVNPLYILEGYHIDKEDNGMFSVNNLRTVTFYDGTAVYATIKNLVNGSAIVQMPVAPTKDGHIFGGWFTDEACTVAFDTATKVTSDLPLYAKWTANQYTITFNTDGGSAIPAIKQAYGTAITAPANPTKSGYTFAGWDKAIPTTMPAEDMTITAKWEKKASSSSSSSSSSKPSTPVKPETPAAPEAGEATVETEVTNGGEVKLETPATGNAPADKPVEPVITGVVLPTGTDSEVTFIPVSEQPAPAGKETQTKKVFEINVPTYEKGKAAVIKFTMTVAELTADGKTAADVALWHFDEETGEWTKLVTSYTIVDGVVYFEAITEDFSPFAIVYEDTPAEEPTEEPTEEPATPAPILAVLAGLGAAVVLRRK